MNKKPTMIIIGVLAVAAIAIAAVIFVRLKSAPQSAGTESTPPAAVGTVDGGAPADGAMPVEGQPAGSDSAAPTDAGAAAGAPTAPADGSAPAPTDAGQQQPTDQGAQPGH